MDKDALTMASIDPPLQLSPMPIRIAKDDDCSRERANRQRAMIRAMARTVLAERGYSGVHMRDLASRCGISAQTLYNNLGGREDILFSAIDELLRVQIARANAESHRTGRNFMLVFCDLTARLMEPDWNYVHAIIAMLGDQEHRPLLAEKYEQRCIAAYRSHLLAMQQAGSLKHWVDVDVLSNTLQDTIRTVLTTQTRQCRDAGRLRDRLMMNVGLPLLGVTCRADAVRIEADINQLFKKRRSESGSAAFSTNN